MVSTIKRDVWLAPSLWTAMILLATSLIPMAVAAQMVPVTLQFKLVDNGAEIGCDDVLTGFGEDGLSSVGISDFRFYVSNLQFYGEDGNVLPSELEVNAFQYVDEHGAVALIDFTSATSGSCANSAIAFSEGTERINTQIAAMVEHGTISKVTFDVGVPQALMKAIIATRSAEDTPSPLGEMYWSWATGYRHLVFNFVVISGTQERGEGYVHIGSQDCGGDGARALTDREACGLIYTPAVWLNGFDPAVHVVTVNVRNILQGLRFITDIYNTEPPFEIIGQGPGVACHSSPTEMQPDCGVIFANFGVGIDSGGSLSDFNQVFSYE